MYLLINQAQGYVLCAQGQSQQWNSAYAIDSHVQCCGSHALLQTQSPICVAQLAAEVAAEVTLLLLLRGACCSTDDAAAGDGTALLFRTKPGLPHCDVTELHFGHLNVLGKSGDLN
jgi:hypothetical protein